MATPGLAPSASTLSMSPDRKLLGKIAGQLYIARKILLEGTACQMSEVRHEIRTLMLGHMPEEPNSNNEDEELSTQRGWLKLVVKMLRRVQQVPAGVQNLPDDLKRELARLIKQGLNLCAASEDARKEIKQAMVLYRRLGGPSYL